jgi:hypothetical protein
MYEHVPHTAVLAVKSAGLDIFAQRHAPTAMVDGHFVTKGVVLSDFQDQNQV